MTRSAQPAPMVRESALRKNGPCSMTIGVACVDRFELGCRWDGDRDCDDEEDEEDVKDADDDHDDDNDDKNEEENDSPGEDEEPLNSEDDVSDEEPNELFETDNVVVCQYDKVSSGASLSPLTCVAGDADHPESQQVEVPPQGRSHESQWEGPRLPESSWQC